MATTSKVSPSLYVELFSGLRAGVEGEAATEFPPQYPGVVLAFLALFGKQPQNREVVMERLWPEDDLEETRRRLRQCLYLLRRDLEKPPLPKASLFLTTRTTLQLNPDLFHTDVTAFEETLKAAAKAEDPATRIRLYEDALCLYRGDLLPGFYQDCFLREQQRLSEACRGALLSLTSLYEEQGARDRAIETARRAVAAFPAMEEAHAALMRLYAAAGQPSAVLRQYQELGRILRDELGEAPSPETRRLMESLRQEGLARLAAHVDAPPLRERRAPSAVPPPAVSAPDRDGNGAATPPAATPQLPPSVSVARMPRPPAPLRWSLLSHPAWALLCMGALAMVVALWFQIAALRGSKAPPEAGARGGAVMAAPPAEGRVLWQARFPRLTGERDSEPTALATDAAGNIYVAGFVQTAKRDVDFAILKYAGDGKLLWQQRYNGSGNDVDRARSIAVDLQGNVYVTGESYNDRGNERTRLSGLDYVTIKYNPHGKVLWVAQRDGGYDGEDWPQKIAVDAQGGVYVTGYSWHPGAPPGKPDRFRCLTVKYLPDGTEAWAKTFAGEEGDARVFDLALDAAGSVYVAGVCRGGGPKLGGMNFLTIRYDAKNGNRLWWRPWGGDGPDRAKRLAIDATGGGVYVGGDLYRGDAANRGTEQDLAVVKYSPAGNLLWTCPDAGPWNSFVGDDGFQALAADGDGVFFTGEVANAEKALDIYVVRIGRDGAFRWRRTYNGTVSDNDVGIALAPDGQGGVFVTGRSRSGNTGSATGTLNDIITLRYGPDGRPAWRGVHNGPRNEDGFPAALTLTPDGNPVVTGQSRAETTSDIVVLQYAVRP